MAGNVGVVTKRLEPGGSDVVYPYNTAVTGGYLTDTKSGGKTPDFIRLKDSGSILPVNAYERFWSDGWPCVSYASQMHGSVDGCRNQSWYETTFALNFAATPLNTNAIKTLFATDIEIAKNEANTLLQKRLNNIGWEMAVDVAEVNKTAAMIVDRAHALINFVRLFRNDKASLMTNAQRLLKSRPSPGYKGPSKWKKLNPLLNDLNDAYLELTYGWNPLANSLEDGFSTMYDILTEAPTRLKVSAHAFKQSTKGYSVSGVSGPFAAHGSYTYLNLQTMRTDVWAGGLLSQPDAYMNADVRLGLTLGNVLPTLWELTRLSFVADYFANIGSTLLNFSGALQRVQQQTSFLSTKVQFDNQIVLVDVSAIPDSACVDYSLESLRVHPVSQQRAVWFKRQKTSPIDHIIRFQLKGPTWTQWFNVVALLKPFRRR